MSKKQSIKQKTHLVNYSLIAAISAFLSALDFIDNVTRSLVVTASLTLRVSDLFSIVATVSGIYIAQKFHKSDFTPSEAYTRSMKRLNLKRMTILGAITPVLVTLSQMRSIQNIIILETTNVEVDLSKTIALLAAGMSFYLFSQFRRLEA